jgi:hypothetical protein
MKQTTTNRLPGLDESTRRSEAAAFTTLGLTAAAMIIFAYWQAAQFKSDSDSMSVTFTHDFGTVKIQAAELDTNNSGVARPNELSRAVTNRDKSGPAGPRS